MPGSANPSPLCPQARMEQSVSLMDRGWCEVPGWFGFRVPFCLVGWSFFSISSGDGVFQSLNGGRSC